MLFRIAQVSMALSFYWTYRSLYHTWGHGFNDSFAGQLYSGHAQFHALREVFVSVAVMVVVGIFMYGPKSVRTPIAWWVMLISSAFLTIGVWLALQLTGNSFPNLGASMNHILNTAFAALALALCWKEYQSENQAA